MFGGPLEYPQYVKPKHCKPELGETDLFMPHGTKVGLYAHRGREPNTDYDARMLHYKQREEELGTKFSSSSEKQDTRELINIRYQKHAEKKRLQNRIKTRLEEKIKLHVEGIERRREKLRELFAVEEREFIRETVDVMQKADDDKLQNMKKRCNEIRAQKEAERKEIVKLKRIQQYGQRIVDLRPFIAKKHLQETKLVHLQQMRDNESRREAEKELDKLWLDVQKRQDAAILERETQEAIKKFERDKKDKEILDMQVKAKKLLEEERKAIALSDREEMQKLLKQLHEKELEDQRRTKENREKEAKENQEQLRMKEEFNAQRLKEEKALQDALKQLTELEVEKEKAAKLNKSIAMRREVAMYNQHLKELAEIRKLEEQECDKVIQEVLKETERKHVEKQCVHINAMTKLREEVMEGRRKQVEFKKMEAQKELEYQQKENEMYRNLLEDHRRLNEESKKLALEACKQYRNDLRKQIEYNNLLRDREIKEMESRLQKGIEEENRYQETIRELLVSDVWESLQKKHPFRKLVEKYDCHCYDEEGKHIIQKK